MTAADDDQELTWQRERELFKARRAAAAYLRWRLTNWRGMQARDQAKRQERAARRAQKLKEQQQSPE